MKLALLPLLLVLSLGRLEARPRLFGQLQKQQQKQQKQAERQNLQPAVRPNGTLRPAVRRTLAQDTIYAFYLRQFRQDGDFSDELIGKINPFLDDFLRERFELSERRARALNQLRQAFNRNASEDELTRLTRDLDAADSEFQANHQKFLNSIDPLLTPRQQAKVRVLQDRADKQIRQTLEAIQNPNRGTR